MTFKSFLQIFQDKIRYLIFFQFEEIEAGVSKCSERRKS